MKKRIIALGLLWCLSAVMLQAARVDTVLVRSAAMNKDVKVVYVLPDKAIGKQACPASVAPSSAHCRHNRATDKPPDKPACR